MASALWLGFFIFPIALVAQLSFAGIAPDSQSEKVEALVSKIQQAKERLVRSERQKRETLGRLYEIQNRLRRVSNDKNRLTNEMLVLRGNVKNFAQIIARLEITIAEQKRRIIRRLRSLGQLGQLGYVKMILSESRPLEIERTMRFLKLLAKRDFELLDNYQDNIQNLIRKRDELAEEVRHLVALEKKVSEQEQVIANEHNKKKEILTSLENQVFMSSGQIDEMRKKGQSLMGSMGVDEEIKQMLGPFFFEQKGRLPPPIDVPIAKNFGLFTDGPDIRLIHKGIRFSARGPRDVRSVFSGKIAFVGEVRGRGTTVIINHGDSYYSVYAQLQSAPVQTGQAVVARQLIGRTRNSLSEADGLYFEVRHFSIPEDPSRWLSEGDLRLAEHEGQSNKS